LQPPYHEAITLLTKGILIMTKVYTVEEHLPEFRFNLVWIADTFENAQFEALDLVNGTHTGESEGKQTDSYITHDDNRAWVFGNESTNRYAIVTQWHVSVTDRRLAE